MLEVLAVIAIMTIGATVQASIGFGSALIAVPLLLLIDPVLVPGPMLFSTLILAILITYRFRQSIHITGLRAAIFGRIPGAIAGAFLLTVLSTNVIAIFLGVLVLVAVGISITGIHVRPSIRNLFFIGSLSGFMGTTTSIGGPPMALIYQHETASRFRGTINGFFIAGIIISLSALYFVGELGQTELLASLALLPGILLGFLISLWTTKILKQHYLRPAILTISSLTAIAVIVSNL